MIFAVGGGLAVYDMHMYSDQLSTQLAPEVVAYAYLPIKSDFLLRIGARVNYAWDQSQNSKSLHISETDFRYFGELSVVYNWILMLAVGIGVGADYRSVKLETKPPINVQNSHITNSKNLAAMYIQAGIGFPLIKGVLVVEPYGRYTVVQNPAENTWGYGIEATVQIY